MNSEFTNGKQHFANFLKQQSPDDLAAKQACPAQTTVRQLSEADIQRGINLIKELKGLGVSDDDALKYFCLVTYNLNEFLYID